jgi:hypothetical protein
VALTEWHPGPFLGVRWRLSAAGVEIEGTGVERTRGQPITATRIWERWSEPINRQARAFRVPCALIVGTICIESHGQEDAIRQEPGYVSDDQTPGKVSVGLMQTLIKTARDTLQMSLDRSWLLKGDNSIQAGTAYIAQQSRVTGLDPPLVGAAYNAGGLYEQTGAQNRWKLRQYPIGTGDYLDHFIPFFNDAAAVLDGHSIRPSVGLETLLGDAVPACTHPPASTAGDGNGSGTKLKVEFGPNARQDVVSAYTRDVLSGIMRTAGVDRVVVTSTYRTVEEEARVMYANVEKQGVDHELNLYAKPGREVIKEYARSKGAGNPPDRIIDDMVHKIKELGSTNVSHHNWDPAVLSVFDISPRSVAKQGDFEAAINSEHRVSKFFKPPQDSSYHLEVPQPK